MSDGDIAFVVYCAGVVVHLVISGIARGMTDGEAMPWWTRDGEPGPAFGFVLWPLTVPHLLGKGIGLLARRRRERIAAERAERERLLAEPLP